MRENQTGRNHGISQRPQILNDSQLDSSLHQFGWRVVEDLYARRDNRFTAHVITGAGIQALEGLRRHVVTIEPG